jgi:hypothetical protein
VFFLLLQPSKCVPNNSWVLACFQQLSAIAVRSLYRTIFASPSCCLFTRYPFVTPHPSLPLPGLEPTPGDCFQSLTAISNPGGLEAVTSGPEEPQSVSAADVSLAPPLSHQRVNCRVDSIIKYIIFQVPICVTPRPLGLKRKSKDDHREHRGKDEGTKIGPIRRSSIPGKAQTAGETPALQAASRRFCQSTRRRARTFGLSGTC